MPKRYIGIDIGRSHVCAAQVARTAEGVRVEKAFAMQTRRNSDSLPAILHSLTDKHGFDRRAETVVCLPHQAFFFADMETDARGLESIRAPAATGLNDCFPIPADDIVAQVCSVLPLEGGKSSVLVAASSRGQLGEGLHLLSEGRIKPACIDTPTTAVHATILTNHPESATGLAVVLHVDFATLSLAVTQEGRLLLVRNIPTFSSGDQDAKTVAQETADLVAREIEMTWKRLFDNAPDPGSRLFLVAPAPMAGPLASALQEKTGGRVIPVDPYAQVARAEDVDADLPICVAEGLALRALQPEKSRHIDFLAAYRARTRPKLRLTRELSVCGGLAVAAGIVWVAGLFLQLSSLETTYGQLRKQMETVFRETVPDEQNIVDPAAQLQQRLDALRKECGLLTSLNPGRSAPLEILYALSRSTPATADVKLHDVLIAADSVRISGSCDSFTTLSEWQRQLEAIPGLQVVDVPRPTKDAQSGKVRFTISLSTSASKA
jgi:Tfp pilus assembly PilM family ATPase/Tfp pilus assembly protein PilN